MQCRQSRGEVFGGRPKTFAKSQKSIKERETYEEKSLKIISCENVECSFHKLA